MKFILSILILLLTVGSFCQSKNLIISTEGIDSIKIGMSPRTVERIIGNKLQHYILSDSLFKDSINNFPFSKPNTYYYKCNYQGADLILQFFSGIRLDVISSVNGLNNIQTNSGIKVGISQEEFIKICIKNNLNYSYMTNKKGCFVSDDSNRRDNSLFVQFVNAIITGISVVRMEGD